MAFPSSSIHCSLHSSSTEPIRALWHDISHRKTSHGGYHFQTSSILNSNTIGSLDLASPCGLSPPSSSNFLSSVEESWGKPSAVLWPNPCNRLFDFNSESSAMEDPLEKEYVYIDTPPSRGPDGGVPVYVMLPLDSVNPNHTLNRPRAINASLQALKSAGVEGVMVDVWWGIVEKEGPQSYNWSGYRELVKMAKESGLRLQVVMSFHQCGGNVGDSCWIPLPPWVKEEIDRNPDLVYTDKEGRRNYEYLSLGCDLLPVVRGRSPVQIYSDFMRSFRKEFVDYLGEVIVEIQVGLGPAGELRYPAYPESSNTWHFPGVGEFQCYDKFMLSSLQASAESLGHPEWAKGGSHAAGNYKQFPEETGFFQHEGGWNTPYGRFFLGWYSGMLLEHGERILSAAEGIFRGTGAKLSGKVAGIHWHYGTRSHSAELTAGYYNTRSRDGYIPIAQMFGRHGVTLNFTCFEMKDSEQYPQSALCSPEGLLKQVTLAARRASVSLAGENALLRFDEGAQNQIVRNSRLPDHDCITYEPMCSFTFLRMTEQLFRPDNWRRFVQFVQQMAEGRSIQPWEEKHLATDLYMRATTSLIREAEVAMMCK